MIIFRNNCKVSPLKFAGAIAMNILMNQDGKCGNIKKLFNFLPLNSNYSSLNAFKNLQEKKFSSAF